jgi:hypothetical protein
MIELKLKMLYAKNKDDIEEGRKHIHQYVLSGCDYFDLLGSTGELVEVKEDCFKVNINGKNYFSSCIAFIDMVV